MRPRRVAELVISRSPSRHDATSSRDGGWHRAVEGADSDHESPPRAKTHWKHLRPRGAAPSASRGPPRSGYRRARPSTIARGSGRTMRPETITLVSVRCTGLNARRLQLPLCPRTDRPTVLRDGTVQGIEDIASSHRSPSSGTRRQVHRGPRREATSVRASIPSTGRSMARSHCCNGPMPALRRQVRSSGAHGLSSSANLGRCAPASARSWGERTFSSCGLGPLALTLRQREVETLHSRLERAGAWQRWRLPNLDLLAGCPLTSQPTPSNGHRQVRAGRSPAHSPFVNACSASCFLTHGAPQHRGDVTPPWGDVSDHDAT
jgi:hypothetical protein